MSCQCRMGGAIIVAELCRTTRAGMVDCRPRGSFPVYEGPFLPRPRWPHHRTGLGHVK